MSKTVTAQIDIPHERIADFCQRYNILRMALFGSVIRDDFTLRERRGRPGGVCAGAVADLDRPQDQWQDPSLEPNWINKHPAELDSTIPLEDIIEADRAARNRIEGMRKEREEFQEEFGDREDTEPCDECEDGWPCEYHATAEELSRSEEEVLNTVRGMRNMDHLPRPPLLRREWHPKTPPSTPQRRLTNLCREMGSLSQMQTGIIPAQSLPRTPIRGRNPEGRGWEVCQS